MINRFIYGKAAIVAPAIILLLLAAEYQAAGEEISNIGLGHFGGRSLSPGLGLRPGVTMVRMPVNPKGTMTVGMEGSWGNIWNYEPGAYTIDGEWIRVEPRITYAPWERCEIGIHLPVSGRMGGFADGLIEDFHEQFRLPSARRDEFPRDRLLIEVTDEDGHRVFRDNNSWGINDLPVFASFLLTDGSTLAPAVAAQLTITVPVGDEDEMEGMGSPAYEIGAMLSKRLGKSRLITYLGGSASYCTKKWLMGIPLRRELFNGLLGLEYQCGQRFSVLAQYVISSPVAENFYQFSEPVHELNAGFKWRITNRLVMELSLVENLFNFRNSTDFGMNLGITRSW